MDRSYLFVSGHTVCSCLPRVLALRDLHCLPPLRLIIISDLIKESELFPEVISKEVLIQSDSQSGKIWHIDMTFLN